MVHASNGEEPLAYWGRRSADVLVTDIALSGKMDVWQIAERCRECLYYMTGFSRVPPTSGIRLSALAETL